LPQPGRKFGEGDAFGPVLTRPRSSITSIKAGYFDGRGSRPDPVAIDGAGDEVEVCREIRL
jgi:hypothetical protein